MAEIRLSKLTKEFNIGLQTLVDFLNEKGAGVDMNPNAKISDSYLPAIEAKFGDEQKLKQDSEKVAIKLKEIIELGSKKKSVAEDEEEPVKEIIIKSNSFSHETPVQEPQESHVQKTEPAAEESEPAAKEKTAGSETGSVSADRPEEDKKTLVEGLKIVDKIDLSRFDRKKNHQEKDLPENTGTQEEVHVPAASAEPELASEPVPESGSEPEKKEEPAAGETPVREPREIKIEVEKLQGPKVVDKIDLSQFDKKKKNKKRERIAKGGRQKVEVTKESNEQDD